MADQHGRQPDERHDPNSGRAPGRGAHDAKDQTTTPSQSSKPDQDQERMTDLPSRTGRTTDQPGPTDVDAPEAAEGRVPERSPRQENL